jgi:hypothetical protein
MSSTATTLAAAGAAANGGGYLNTAEVSRKFFGGLSDQTILRFVKEDGLPAHQVKRRWYFDPAEVDAWIHSRGNGVDPYRAAIKKLVDEAPPLTAEQAAKIRAVLGGAA